MTIMNIINACATELAKNATTDPIKNPTHSTSTDGIIGLIKPTNAKTNDNSINIHKTTSIT